MPFFYCFYKYRTFHIKTEISGMGCFLFWTEEFRILGPRLKDFGLEDWEIQGL